MEVREEDMVSLFTDSFRKQQYHIMDFMQFFGIILISKKLIAHNGLFNTYIIFSTETQTVSSWHISEWCIEGDVAAPWRGSGSTKMHLNSVSDYKLAKIHIHVHSCRVPSILFALCILVIHSSNLPAIIKKSTIHSRRFLRDQFYLSIIFSQGAVCSYDPFYYLIYFYCMIFIA